MPIVATIKEFHTQEPHQHAVRDTDRERESCRQHHRGQEVGVVSGGDMGRNDDGQRYAARNREVEASLLDDQHLAKPNDDKNGGEWEASRPGRRTKCSTARTGGTEL